MSAYERSGTALSALLDARDTLDAARRTQLLDRVNAHDNATYASLRVTTQELRTLAAAVLSEDVQTLARTTDYLRRSYRVVFIGYVAMMIFGVGAIVAAFIKGMTASSIGDAVAAVGLAGLTVGIFVAFFVQRPSAALERNAIFMPWVSIVLTTFWTRMLYLDDPATLDAKLGHAAKEASDELNEMVKDAGSRVERQASRRSRYGSLGFGWWMSLFPRGSKLDRHQHIGQGTIGTAAFKRLLNDPRAAHAAFIAETPIDEPGDDLRNVNALKSLVEDFEPTSGNGSKPRRAPAKAARK